MAGALAFASSAEVMRDLVTRTPLFLAKLDAANLRARGVRSVPEYLEAYERALLEPTPEERARLAAAAAEARRRCAAAGLTHLLEVDWRVALCAASLENGYPHTVGGTVVLPRTALQRELDSLVRLLVHEITHVHQRRFPVKAAAQARALGFAPVARLRDLRETVRANPDTDGTVYERAGVQVHPILRPGATSLDQVDLCPRASYPGLERAHNPEHVFEIVAEAYAAAV